jgi:glycosyltransferase involved in cell wall biosynthesis
VVGEGRLPACLDTIRGWSNVEILNRFVEENEIEPLFRATDVLVVPYIDASQSGVVPMSFGFGVPVVCTPVGGLIEQVRHAENGLIAGEVAAHALADSLLELHRDPALLERLALGALNTAATELDWPSAVAPLVGFLKRETH